MFRWPDAVERRDSIFGESSPAARDFSYQLREISHFSRKTAVFSKLNFPLINKAGS
jgi:hypothetical protein